jgi:peptide-methionine (S)-S-oxide reductase
MSQAAYFATGCFWGAERRFWQLEGVTQTSVGYMGGSKSDPTYEEVCSGKTNHAEMVEVIYDSSIISYEKLLAEFWVMHDPTSLNQQGGDIGTQYRSAIFTTSTEQLSQASFSREIYQKELSNNGMDKIVTEISPATGVTYWLAEDYHQKYLVKNPNGYDCHSSTGVAYPLIVSSTNE